MNKLKPSEVANICLFGILPAIAFLALSVYSFIHCYGPTPQCDGDSGLRICGGDCIYGFIVFFWYAVVLLLMFVCASLILSKAWNLWMKWLSGLDRESGF